MKTASVALFATGYLGALAFAFKYLMAREYFSNLRQVAGKPWDELGEGLRAVILALMHFYGGSLFAVAATGLWLTGLYAADRPIPVLLVLLPGLATGGLTLWGGIILIRHGGSWQPRIQVLALVAIILLAAIIGLAAS